MPNCKKLHRGLSLKYSYSSILLCYPEILYHFCGGFVTTDVLAKGLRCGAIATWLAGRGLMGQRTQGVYPGSAPRNEVKAYVLLLVVLLESRLQGSEYA